MTEDAGDVACLAKWSSLDLLAEEECDTAPNEKKDKNGEIIIPISVSTWINIVFSDDSIFSSIYLQRVASERGIRKMFQKGKVNSLDATCPDSPNASSGNLPCNTTVLLLVLHAGSVLDTNVDMAAKKSDVTTFRGAFESVMRQHYPSLLSHIALRLVSCPSICTEGLGILSRFVGACKMKFVPMCAMFVHYNMFAVSVHTVLMCHLHV